MPSQLKYDIEKIGFQEKTRILKEGRWYDEVLRRQKLPHYMQREVMVSVEWSHYFHAVHIKDQGKGFNWRYYIGRSSSGDIPNGRGLAIVSATGFDEVLFNDRGNEVSCVMRFR